MKNCPECHHLPSDRVVEGYGQCYCKCHDIADAAPALLAALQDCKEYIHGFADHGQSVTASHLYEQARLAIAQAEGHE